MADRRAALLATVIENREAVDGLRLARLTVEFLSPVPVGDLVIATRVLRPGRRVRLIEASMEVDGRPVVLARAWQIAIQPDLLPPKPTTLPPPLPAPASLPPLPGAWMEGYAAAIEWRFVSGGFHTSGPSEVWARPRIPLVTDQPLTGLQRLLIVADSANGISSVLQFTDWLFVPTSLTVTLHRHPLGDWIFMRAASTLATDGIGSCHADLADATGFLGTATQPLVVAAAPPTPDQPRNPGDRGDRAHDLYAHRAHSSSSGRPVRTRLTSEQVNPYFCRY
jgi:hypothetical protein